MYHAHDWDGLPYQCTDLQLPSPLISIFTYLARLPPQMRPAEIHFLYSTKTNHDLDPQTILFLPRLMDLVAIAADPNVTLSCFLTGLGDEGAIEHGKLPNRTFGRRLIEADLVRALGPAHDRQNTVSYVCGPAKMTEEIVDVIRRQEGMDDDRVLLERWW